MAVDLGQRWPAQLIPGFGVWEMKDINFSISMLARVRQTTEHTHVCHIDLANRRRAWVPKQVRAEQQSAEHK